MKKIVDHMFLIQYLLWVLPLLWNGTAMAAEMLPHLELHVPADDNSKRYLGLTGKAGERFALGDIQADILLIELFSMYCPYCQDAAPAVNELYEKLEDVSKNGPVVKIIGLGASNSQFEVEHFRDTYDISFPLFPDRDMSMYRALAGAGTPTFIGCRLRHDGNSAIVLRKSGGFRSADDFLRTLLRMGGW